MAQKEKRPTFDDAHESFQEGDYEAALEICDEIIGEDESKAPADVLWLAGECLLQLQEPGEALHLLDAADEAEPEQPAIQLARGVALFELLRWDESEKALRAASEGDDALGDAWYFLGLLEERRGNSEAAERLFTRAVQSDPENLHAPTRWPDQEVAKAWTMIAEDLPEPASRWFRSIEYIVKPFPAEVDLRRDDGNVSPLVHCLFFGEGPGEATGSDPARWFRGAPPRVELYTGNLGKSAHDAYDLQQEIFEAFLWETIEFLGLDEDQAERFGQLVEGADEES